MCAFTSAYACVGSLLRVYYIFTSWRGGGQLPPCGILRPLHLCAETVTHRRVPPPVCRHASALFVTQTARNFYVYNKLRTSDNISVRDISNYYYYYYFYLFFLSFSVAPKSYNASPIPARRRPHAPTTRLSRELRPISHSSSLAHSSTVFVSNGLGSYTSDKTCFILFVNNSGDFFTSVCNKKLR